MKTEKNEKITYMKLKIVIIAAILFLIYLFIKCKKIDINKTEKTNVLLVGINAEFPPFSFIENGDFVGFDIDLAKEIACRLNKKIEFKNMPFSTLLPSLQLNTIDCIISGLTYTKERAEEVFLTEPYLKKELVLLSLSSDPINDIENIGTSEVIVNQGYTSDLYASSIPELRIIRLKSPAEAFLALKSKRGVVFILEETIAQAYLKNQNKNEFYLSKMLNSKEDTVIAINKNNTRLQQKINTALQDIKEDGTLKKLIEKWNL